MREVVLAAAREHLRFIKPSGPDNIGGPCPFHKDGQERKPSFYMSLTKGVYFCHSCGAKGTFIQFLKRMGTKASVIDQMMSEVRPETQTDREKRMFGANLNQGEHRINEGLLGVFQFCPNDLVNDGFDKKVLQEHEVGFDKKQMRITFPIRDLDGNLVGISGRTVINEDPRYKVYKSGDLLKYASDDPETQARYRAYDIKNHHYIWNAHNVYPMVFSGDLGCVIVVEGYKACLWLLQHDIENVVAIQGSRLAWSQQRILSRLDATVILLLDNNKAGREGSFNIGKRLIRSGLPVLVCSYPQWCDQNVQPDDLEHEEIITMLDTARTFHDWRNQSCNTHLGESRR